MSSQWVDANGNPWRYSTVSQSWQRLLDNSWVAGSPPPGGLQRSVTGGARDVVIAPPWPVPENCPPDGQWIDEDGKLWRYSATAAAWQHFVNGTWLNSAPPAGGLKKLTDSDELSQVIVVENQGPRGPEGPRGPVGVGGLAVAEVLSFEYQDGLNSTFPLSTPADLSQAVQVFRNGLLEVQGYGYLVTPTHVTFTTPPLDSDVLTVVYQKAQ